MGVEREATRVARFAVLVDLAGNGLVEQLGALKPERAVDEVVLIINNDEQPLHAFLP